MSGIAARAAERAVTPGRPRPRRVAPVAMPLVGWLLVGWGAAARAQEPRRAAAPPPAREAAAPQLVTVRPREPVRFDAQVVVPTFYDRDFWPAIRAGVDVASPIVRAAAPAGAAPAVAAPGAPRATRPAPGRAARGRRPR